MKKTFKTKAELINAMYELGIKNMSGFLTDLIHDKEGINRLDGESSLFTIYWVVRKNGTHIRATMVEAAEVAAAWSKEYCFTARIRKEEETKCFSLEIIDNK